MTPLKEKELKPPEHLLCAKVLAVFLKYFI